MDTYNFKGKKILIAEDEDDNYLLLEAFLEPTQAQLFHARNGQEVFELFEQNNDLNIILMDIKMPGINGMEAAQKIKKQRPDLPIIAQTAYAMQNEKIEILKAGCDAILTKPLMEDNVMDTINDYIL